MSSSNDSDWFINSVIGAVMLVIGAVVVVIGFFILSWLLLLANLSALPGQLSEIEQLRADAAVVDPAQAEDVIGQVTQWNQEIRRSQTDNHNWWSAIATPDEWDTVQLIPVPRP